MSGWGIGKAAVAVAATALLAGCSVNVEPLQPAETAAIVKQDRTLILGDQEKIEAPLTLYDVLARVAAYNLDNRTRMMEEALANSQLDLARFDMLPTLAAQAGFSSRDNANASTSRSILTQSQSLEPSTSTDRDRVTADLRLSWNVLDFGVSYYQAKQQADRYLIAQSNRRKLMGRLLQQARASFFRAAAAQQLRPDVEKMMAETKAALADVEKADREKLRPRVANLQMKRTLLEIIGQLEALDQQLSMAEIELKGLINVFPTTRIELVLPEKRAAMPQLAASPESLELLALVNSTDVQEALYTLRVEQAESKKALLRLLPGLEFYGSVNYDSNRFLVHDSWREAGTRTTWNLMRIAAAPATLEMAEARSKLAETRRLALNMAVISRLHMSLWRYKDMVVQFQRANEIDDIERDLSQLASAAESADAGSAIERIRNNASALRARMRTHESYANAHEALGAVFVSLGLDPVPQNYRQTGIADLAGKFQAAFEGWESGQFPAVPEPPPAAEEEPETKSLLEKWFG